MKFVLITYIMFGSATRFTWKFSLIIYLFDFYFIIMSYFNQNEFLFVAS